MSKKRVHSALILLSFHRSRHTDSHSTLFIFLLPGEKGYIFLFKGIVMPFVASSFKIISRECGRLCVLQCFVLGE